MQPQSTDLEQPSSVTLCYCPTTLISLRFKPKTEDKKIYKKGLFAVSISKKKKRFSLAFIFEMISAFLTREEETTEYLLPQINGTKEQQEAATEVYHQFNITTESARTIVKQFMEEMQKGLDHDDATGKTEDAEPSTSKLII